MTFSIFDAGTLVVSYDDERAAHEALQRLAADAPGAGDRLLLVAFDDAGEVVDDAVPIEHVTA